MEYHRSANSCQYSLLGLGLHVEVIVFPKALKLYSKIKAPVLGGSWVVIGVVLSSLIWVITLVILLIAPVITTHEPPSRP